MKTGSGKAEGKCYKGKATHVNIRGVEMIIVASSDAELQKAVDLMGGQKLKKSKNRYVSVFSLRRFDGH